jgi:hypothetical protein
MAEYVGGLPAIAPSAPPEVEITVAGNMPFTTAGVGQVPDSPEVSPKELKEMRRKDGQVRALLRILTLPIRSALREANWGPGEDGAEQEAEFMNLMFSLPPQSGGMTKPMTRVLPEILLALLERFSAFELVFRYVEDGPLKGKWAIKKMAHRSSDTISFLTDDHGGYAGFRQVASFKGRVVDAKLPPWKTFYYAACEEENPFYGVSLFESAFYHYDKKIKLYYLAHIAAQVRAMGVRVAKYPPNWDSSRKASMRSALEKMGFNTAIMLPEGGTIDALRLGDSFDYLGLIQHHNHMMSQSVLAGFIDRDQTSGTLITFQGSDKDEMFIIAEEALMDEISAAITTYIAPNLIDWNFASNKYPTYTLGKLTDAARDMLSSLYQTMATAATNRMSAELLFEMERKIAEQLGLDDEIDYNQLKKEMEAQKKLDQDVKDAEAKAKTAPPIPPPAAPGLAPGPPAPAAPPAKAAPVPLAMSAQTMGLDYVPLTDLMELAEAFGDTEPRDSDTGHTAETG